MRRAARDAIRQREKRLLSRCLPNVQIGTHDSPSFQGKGKPKEHDKTVRKAKEAGVLPINNFITISDTSHYRLFGA